ncbi:unnamed protein product [Ilex paraguariensis]|uniref:Uncharacterized protein n=1 Tax=Ilex paraguariensis TaxID=185542 RepID=A0ABC8R4Y2_9AQUA
MQALVQTNGLSKVKAPKKKVVAILWVETAREVMIAKHFSMHKVASDTFFVSKPMKRRAKEHAYNHKLVVASPADLVKVRMQADGRMLSQGLQPRLRRTLERSSPNVQRAFLVNLGELACYDHAKRSIIENQIFSDNIYAHTLASIMSGLSATVLSCPADVVKTRMMNQPVIKEVFSHREVTVEHQL